MWALLKKNEGHPARAESHFAAKPQSCGNGHMRRRRARSWRVALSSNGAAEAVWAKLGPVGLASDFEGVARRSFPTQARSSRHLPKGDSCRADRGKLLLDPEGACAVTKRTCHHRSKVKTLCACCFAVCKPQAAQPRKQLMHCVTLGHL